MKPPHSFWLAVSVSLAGAIACPQAMAQTVPDGTLPVNSMVTPNGEILTIDGGTAAGGNLFHSFREFNVANGETAHFNNAFTINNIITRVTGGNVSNIDGIIRANGTAHLFLINPAGLVFGPNARLDIGGSFMGSTAQALQFEDGSFYSAVDVDAPPLLTVNVPVGLQFGPEPGGIQVEGMDGEHNLRFANLPLALENSPDLLLREDRPPGLQVQPDRTLALVGGNINLRGGNLTAEGGRIELGSVAGNSTVTLESIDSLAPEVGWQLGYDGVGAFGDIQLSDAASIDTSGPGAGAVQVQGRSLSLRDGSVIIALTLEDEAGGDVIIRTTDSIEFVGTTPGEKLEDNSILEGTTIQSGVIADVEFEATGDGGNVIIETERFLVENGGSVSVSTRSVGDAGDLTIDAADVILTGGRIFREPNGKTDSDFSGLRSLVSPGSTGDSGEITINTDRLVVSGGAVISGATRGEGNGGAIAIHATESITLERDLDFQQNSVISAVAGGRATGDGGDVTVESDGLLVLTDGSHIAVTTRGAGNAGNLTVRAAEIELSGMDPNNQRPTRLEAQSNPNASGHAGDLEIETDLLWLFDGAALSAATQGDGNHGNITIETITLVLDDSRISANANVTSGGNITITASGIFTDRNSTITASSELGIDGTIILNTPEVDPSNGLLELPGIPIDATALIGRDPCKQGQGSAFFIPGRGGLPPTPQEPMEEGFVELVKLDRRDDRTADENIWEPQPDRLVEAQGWILEPDGTVILTANPPTATPHGTSSVSESPNCQF